MQRWVKYHGCRQIGLQVTVASTEANDWFIVFSLLLYRKQIVHIRHRPCGSQAWQSCHVDVGGLTCRVQTSSKDAKVPLPALHSDCKLDCMSWFQARGYEWCVQIRVVRKRHILVAPCLFTTACDLSKGRSRRKHEWKRLKQWNLRIFTLLLPASQTWVNSRLLIVNRWMSFFSFKLWYFGVL